MRNPSLLPKNIARTIIATWSKQTAIVCIGDEQEQRDLSVLCVLLPFVWAMSHPNQTNWNALSHQENRRKAKEQHDRKIKSKGSFNGCGLRLFRYENISALTTFHIFTWNLVEWRRFRWTDTPYYLSHSIVSFACHLHALQPTVWLRHVSDFHKLFMLLSLRHTHSHPQWYRHESQKRAKSSNKKCDIFWSVWNQIRSVSFGEYKLSAFKFTFAPSL